MKNFKRCKAISIILSSALILQPSAAIADSNIGTEESKLQMAPTSIVKANSNVGIEESKIEMIPTAIMDENSNIDTEESKLEMVSTPIIEQNFNIGIEENKLETSINENSVTTPPAVMLDGLDANEYTAKLQQKIDETLAKVEADKKNGTVFAEKELDKELYLLPDGSHDSLGYLNEIIETARKLIAENSIDQEAIQKASDAIDEVYKKLRTIDTYDSFSGIDGLSWKDTNGIRIQAHGGHVQKLGDKWWWYGEDKTKGYRSNGISAYSSDDLYNWNFEGFVMRTIKDRDQLDNDEYFKKLYGDLSSEEKDKVFQAINGGYWLDGNEAGSVIERPKMIYNEKTGKYIIWFHADGPTHQWPGTNYAAACAGVAISDTPNGPFKFIDRYRLNTDPDSSSTNNPGMARDMNLFIDDDKTAYIVYSSEENATMYISKLNEDYTSLTKTDITKAEKGEDYTYLGNPDANKGVKGEDYARIFANWHREAPALFKYNGKYYIISSGTSGWSPNQAKYAVADNILGEWTEIGDPCINDSDRKTFYSQSTSVINYDKESGKLIYMGDRWKDWDLGDSRYIWLPAEFDLNGNLSIKPYTNWKLEDLENKYTVHINTELKELYASVNELPKTLNVKVYRDDNGADKDINVVWDTSNLKSMEKGIVNGVLNIDGREVWVQANLINIPEGLKYYIDCGVKDGATSTIYNLVKNKVKNKDVCDKAYENGSWGYVGKIGEDIGYHSENNPDAFESGFWAEKDKPIEYKVDLEAGKYKLFAGFNEWWSTNRNMGISIDYVDTTGNVIRKQLGDFWNDGKEMVNYGFDLPNKSKVTISINKFNENDVILSWLAIESDNVEVVRDGMKEVYNEVSELPSKLNVKVLEDGNWVEKSTAVIWDIPKLKFLEKTKLTGRLNELGKEVTVDFMYIPKELQYYIDCGAKNGSTMHDSIKQKVELKNNEACDQAYTTGSWGYVSKIGEDIGYHSEDSLNSYDSGFYANDDKSIDYVVPLKAGTYKLFSGFKEWWEDSTLYRGIGISISYKDANGKTVKKELGSGALIDRLILDTNFNIPEDVDVTISIHMFNHEEENVVLSWLAIEKNPSTTPWINVTPASKVDPSIPWTPLEPSTKVDPSIPWTPLEPSTKVEPSIPWTPLEPSTKVDPSIPWTPLEPSTKVDPSIPWTPLEPSTKVDPSIPWTPLEPSTKVDPSIPWTPLEPSTKVDPSIPWTPLEPSTKVDQSIPWTPLEPSTKVDPSIPWTPLEPSTKVDPSIPWTPLEPSTKVDQSIPWTPLEPSTKVDQSIPGTPLEPSTPIKENSGSSSSNSRRSRSDNKASEITAEQETNKTTNQELPQNGWSKGSDNNWKYTENGKPAVGWKQVDNNWYYMNNSGAMQTGWKQVDNKWYYMGDSGSMKTGWNQVGDKWYYLNESGDMATGWVKENGTWYYLDQSGSMLSNIIVDGYKLGENGALI